jgi:thiol-disulfide isomerase/thioredoxin
MKKSFIVIVVAGALGLALIGISATRWLHVVASQQATVASAAPKVLVPARPRAGDAAQNRIVRFASNAVPAPPFLVPDLDGHAISTADWHGKVVLLNFWATWCPPCREEIPLLTELASRYKDRLQIVGVSMDDAPAEEVRQFAKRFGINYPIVMGSSEMISEYGGVPALPTCFVISPDGLVVQKHEGLYPIDVYDTEVRALLGLPVEATVEKFQDTGQVFLRNASLATELPGVDFTGLDEAQKKAVLKRLNAQTCDCGCKLTLAQCRIHDTGCPVSRQIAEKLIKQMQASKGAGSQATTQ